MTRSERAALGTLLWGLTLSVEAEPETHGRVFAVNVIDSDGKPVPNLAASNFRGEFRGQKVKVVSVSADSLQRRVALLMDTSVSMGKHVTRLNVVSKTAKELVERLAPVHSISLFTLGSDTRQLSPLTRDAGVLQDALVQATGQGAGGSTALYDGTVRASRVFAVPSFGDALCILSDGMDTTSRMNSSQAVAALVRAGVRVFVLRIVNQSSHPPSATPAWAAVESWNRDVTEATGGRIF